MRTVALILSLILLCFHAAIVSAKLFSKNEIIHNIHNNPQKKSFTTSVLSIPRGGRSSSSTTTAVQSTSSKSLSKSSAITHGLKNTLASGLAAACSKTLLAPFDTIKTVQQHTQSTSSISLLQASKIVTSRPGGVLNLYAGLGVSALGSMPSVGLYFGVYSYCKRMIGPKLEQCFGSGRQSYNGKEPICSDGVIRQFSIMCSAAIGKLCYYLVLQNGIHMVSMLI